jgi:iron-sulfur cluster insertion protein
MSAALDHTEQAPPIQVTESAAAKVYALIQEEGNPALKLRAFVTGGGCSGFQYGFSFEEKKNEDDFEIKRKLFLDTKNNINTDIENSITVEITLLVDALSFPYLKGAEIDYRKDINGEQFIIRNNPNTKTTCGCGSSFSTE